MSTNKRFALTAFLMVGMLASGSALATAPLESGSSQVRNYPAVSANVYLSDSEYLHLKTWLDGRLERQAQRERLAGGEDVGYQLTPAEMSEITYLPDDVMESLDLPLSYRNGSRLGFYGGNAVLIIPSSGQLIDVLPDATGELQSLAQFAE